MEIISSLSYLFLVMSDWSVLILRIILGVVLVAHGLPKLKNLKSTADWFASVGFKPGHLWATVAAIVEFFGGLGLILGIFVQPFALLIVLEFIVITIWRIARKEKLVGGFELDLMILGSALVLLSVDTRFTLFSLFL